MSSSHDPFSARFDAIEIDPARAPSKAALEQAMAAVAPPALEEPGFYLIDDAGDRFAVDRETGIITLKDDAILDAERFNVYAARLLVIERSGSRYQMEMKLRVTGHVPQMLGAEDSAFLIDLAAGDATQPAPAAAPEIIAPVAAAPVVEKAFEQPMSWTRYSAAQAMHGKGQLIRTRRAFIVQDLPAEALDSAALSIVEPLPEVGSDAPWSL